MTSYLLKNLVVMDPRGLFDQVQDIYVENGRIKKMDTKLEMEADQVFDLKEHWISPGFVDVHVHLRDPGSPEKETLETGAKAGLTGGFTHLIAMANTKPAIDCAEKVKDFYKKAQKAPIHLYTVCGLTKELRGKEMVDMEAAKEAGAIGFSDDGFPLTNIDLLHQIFQKAKEIDIPISFHEEDPKFLKNQGVNAGKVAESLGLGGADPFSEYSYVARDGALALKYGTRVDIQHISTKAAAQLVKTYYDLGANILGEFTPHHLNYTEEKILEKGTNARMNPPLRSQEDVLGLRELLKEEAFVLATDHAPHTAEEKARKFSSAPSGIVGLEVAFPMAYRATVLEGKASLRQLLDSMTYRPATFYSIPYQGIEEGAVANFTIIDPKEEWTVDEETWKGKSKNSPYEGERVIGKVKMTYVKDKLHLI